MIKVENKAVFGFEGALRGMRNPLNSWHKADSEYDERGNIVELGANDLDLILRLTRAGTSHRKVLRMIHIQMDITAPLYWWKDYDTYKVGTVANGCSTMHKIHDVEFTLDMFAHDGLDDCALHSLILTIDTLNAYREKYIKSGLKDKQAWHSMIKLLPMSYLQKRTVDINYEVAVAIINDREFHKLYEFRELCAILRTFPYLNKIANATVK